MSHPDIKEGLLQTITFDRFEATLVFLFYYHTNCSN